MTDFRAPFPWFGGKRQVAPLVWSRFGDVTNYVEPFFGSGAVLLGRPGWTPDAPWIETVNDKDGYVANFWRALAAAPDEVARWADWPVNENDLHARHSWLLARKAELVARLEGDPDYYDAKIAGWWLWGICLWIGGGWCLGNGHWQAVDGKLVKVENGDGVKRTRVHLGSAGQGEAGTGENGMAAWMQALAARLRRVRVCSGDWTRVCGPTPTVKQGLTGVFLDPPYSAEAGRDETIYNVEDLSVAHDVRAWALEWGVDPRMRIALCGYKGEHDELEAVGWEAVPWKAHGGYGLRGNGNGRANSEREVVWFSPHCLKTEPVIAQLGLFAATD